MASNRRSKSGGGGTNPSKRRCRRNATPELGEGEEGPRGDYSIERILARRLVEGGTEDQFEYFIKWVGYAEEHNSWMEEDLLQTYKYWVAEFNRAEGLKEELEELRRSGSRSAMAASASVTDPPPQLGVISSGAGPATAGGELGLETNGGMMLVKVKTEPGLEEEEPNKSDAGQGQGQSHHDFPMSAVSTYVGSSEAYLDPQAIKKLQESNKALKLELEGNDAKIKGLELESLRARVKSCCLESKLKDKQTNEDALHAEISKLKEELLQSNGKVASLTRELNTARNDVGGDGDAVEELKMDLFRKDGLVAQLMQDLTVARSQLEQMGRDLSRKDAQIASVKQGLKDVEKENERLSKSLTGTRGLVVKLQGELDDSRHSIEQFKTNLWKKEELLLGLQRELKLKKVDLDTQMVKLAKARGEAKQLQDQNMVMHTALAQAQAQISSQTEKLVHVQGQLGAMQRGNDTLRDNLSLNVIRLENCMKDKDTLMKMCKEMMPIVKNNLQSQSQDPEPACDLERASHSNSNSAKSKNSEKDKADELRRKLDAMRNSKRKQTINPTGGGIQIQLQVGNSSKLGRLSQEYAPVKGDDGYRPRKNGQGDANAAGGGSQNQFKGANWSDKYK